jgi:phenylacetic acid degradation operon negative regulatory protein
VTATAAQPGAVDLRPLTARSAVLSLLLGAHPPELPVRDLVRAADFFEISEPTLRVALSRMVAAGDLHRTNATYRLSERLLDRQRRQDAAVHPQTRSWRGDWEIVAITATGRGAADRAELRADLTALRLAELREGVWMRPANLRRRYPRHLAAVVSRFDGRPREDGAELAATLWDLPGWAATGTALLAEIGGCAPTRRFTTAAAIVRHLLADPVLPAQLSPDGWPGDTLRDAYSAYRAELIDFTRPSPP